MLHTKFCENRSTGSGEEDFLKVFIIYGRGGHLGHVTWTIYTNFGSPLEQANSGSHCSLQLLFLLF